LLSPVAAGVAGMGRAWVVAGPSPVGVEVVRAWVTGWLSPVGTAGAGIPPVPLGVVTVVAAGGASARLVGCSPFSWPLTVVSTTVTVLS
jgi:hypothetical protein